MKLHDAVGNGVPDDVMPFSFTVNRTFLAKLFEAVNTQVSASEP